MMVTVTVNRAHEKRNAHLKEKRGVHPDQPLQLKDYILPIPIHIPELVGCKA
jgi:hypothetical protein